MSLQKSQHYYLQNIIPNKITYARELRGFTKKELAEKINKTPSAITQYETGKSNLSLETFLSISQVLSFPLSFFAISDYIPEGNFSQCHFRANKKVAQTEKIKAITYAKLVFSIFSYLESKGIKFPSVSFTTIKNCNAYDKQVENLSLSIRKQLGLSTNPIHNMAQLLESIGIKIILLPTQQVKLDAFAIWLDGKPCVVLDSGSPASRMQFDYAHELAHLILDEDNPTDDALIERRANRFASAFLMPLEKFIEDCPRRYSQKLFVSVKQYWHVSIAAALYRARELGIFSETSYKTAQIIRARAGTRTLEENEFDKGLPTLLNQAFNLIYKEIKLDEIANDLGLHILELRKILELQNVSQTTLDIMMPTKKATIFNFSVQKV